MSPVIDLNKWSGTLIAGGLALATITVQWGVINAKLEHLEKRLDELIFETRSVRGAFADLERRVSFLEGREGR